MKILPIKKSAEFQIIGKKGRKIHSKTVLLISFPSPKSYLQDKNQGKNSADFLRFGLTVSKTVGNAVTRNLAKRRLREAVKKIFAQSGKNHQDYVIIAKREIAKATYEEILENLDFCLKKSDYSPKASLPTSGATTCNSLGLKDNHQKISP